MKNMQENFNSVPKHSPEDPTMPHVHLLSAEIANIRAKLIREGMSEAEANIIAAGKESVATNSIAQNKFKKELKQFYGGKH